MLHVFEIRPEGHDRALRWHAHGVPVADMRFHGLTHNGGGDGVRVGVTCHVTVWVVKEGAEHTVILAHSTPSPPSPPPLHLWVWVGSDAHYCPPPTHTHTHPGVHGSERTPVHHGRVVCLTGVLHQIFPVALHHILAPPCAHLRSCG